MKGVYIVIGPEARAMVCLCREGHDVALGQVSAGRHLVLQLRERSILRVG